MGLILTNFLISFAQDDEAKPIGGLDRQIEEDKDHAYEVLGRGLTKREKEAHGQLSEEALKRNILPREQKLVLVRALLAVGAGEHAREILNIFPLSELKTFRELVNYFTELKEKHGRVDIGIKTEFVYNIKDSEQAFKNAARVAYYEVFGIEEGEQDLGKITNYLESKGAYTYSKMIKAFLDSMTPEVKEKLLFKALDDLGLSHLKENQNFVEKILGQKFTYQNLIKLLKQIPASSGEGKKKAK